MVKPADRCKPWALTHSSRFPITSNAHIRSGVKYIAQPGGSVRDDAVIECCDKYDMAMVFTGIRLFHHCYIKTAHRLG